MRYMLLIYDREVDWEALNEKDKGVIYQEYGAFTESIKKSGKHLASDPLQPVTTATTVRVRNGKTSRPTAPTPRPASSSAATTSSMRRTWTRRRRSRHAFLPRGRARSKSDRSWRCRRSRNGRELVTAGPVSYARRAGR